MTKTKKNNKHRFKYFTDTFLITVSIVFAILIVTYTVKITSGVAKSVSSPEYYVRLEIINATGEPRLETRMEDYLKDLNLENIQLEIVEAGRFELKESEESFLVSRTKDKSAPMQLAKVLNLDYKDMLYTALPHNTRQITATLVLGNDSLLYKLEHSKMELK